MKTSQACLFLTIAFVASGVFLATHSDAEAAVKFRRPLNTTSSPVYYGFFDHDSRSSPSSDYTLNTKKYDCTTGIKYDKHRGTDFKASLDTSIQAGATGMVYDTVNNCATYGSIGSLCGSGWGNHVKIDHEGKVDGQGMISIYAHMKQNTAFSGSCGPAGKITCGQFIGKVGSSGSSDATHLHFEIRPNGTASAPVDPFLGTCSQTYSYWNNQNGGIPTTACSVNAAPTC